MSSASMNQNKLLIVSNSTTLSEHVPKVEINLDIVCKTSDEKSHGTNSQQKVR